MTGEEQDIIQTKTAIWLMVSCSVKEVASTLSINYYAKE